MDALKFNKEVSKALEVKAKKNPTDMLISEIGKTVDKFFEENSFLDMSEQDVDDILKIGDNLKKILKETGNAILSQMSDFLKEYSE